MAEMSTKQKVWPWLVVISYGILNAMTMQMVFSNFGVFVPHILKSMGFSAAEFSFTMTDAILSMAVSIPIMGNLILKVDVRILLSIGLIVSIGAWACNGFWNDVHMWWVTGCLIGLGGGIVFAQTMPIVTGNWFSKNKGTAIGATYMISAALSYSMALILNAVISSLGWRMAYHVLGCVSIVICLIFIWGFIRFKPEQMGLKPYGWTPEDKTTTAEEDTSKLPGIMAKDALKTVCFWLLFIAGGVATLIGSGYSTQMSNAAVGWGFETTIGASLIGMIAIFRFFSPVAGWIGDKFGGVKGMMILLCGCVIGFLGFIFMHGNAIILHIWMLFYACYTVVQNTMMPLLVREFFGSKDFSRCYTYIAVGFSAIGAFGSTITGYMYDVAGNYEGSFWFGIGICVTTAILVLLAKATSKSVKWED